MDWGTIGASVLGSGLVGGVVSFVVARRESKDRQDVLALEREKWEHERDTPRREDRRSTIISAIDLVEGLHSAMWDLQSTARLKRPVTDEYDPHIRKALLAAHDRVVAVRPVLIALNFNGAVEARKALTDYQAVAGTYIQDVYEWSTHDRDEPAPEHSLIDDPYVEVSRSLRGALE